MVGLKVGDIVHLARSRDGAQQWRLRITQLTTRQIDGVQVNNQGVTELKPPQSFLFDDVVVLEVNDVPVF